MVDNKVVRIGFLSWLRPSFYSPSSYSTGRRIRQSRKRSLLTTRKPASRGEDVVELKQLWLQLRSEFFPTRTDLDEYIVRWSRRRQKRTLASCNIVGRVVAVAKEMSHPDAIRWMAPLLYHEMCHAVIGTSVAKQCGKRAWHGREFKSLECRHPQITALDAWIKGGGFHAVVRSERARNTWASRKVGAR